MSIISSPRRRATAIMATASIAALTGTGAAEAVRAVVPNQFVRDCSKVTRRCTNYQQTNGAYNPRVPNRYSTRWVWRPI